MKSFRCPIALLATLAMAIAAWPGRADEPALPVATNLWTATFPGYQNSSSSSPAVAPDGCHLHRHLAGGFGWLTPRTDG